MIGLARNCAKISARLLWVTGCLVLLLLLAACNKQESTSVKNGPRTFASPQEAGKALVDAANAQDQNALLQIFGPGSAAIISSGDAAQDKDALSGFTQAYQVMSRWRRLGDGSEVLLVGADNQPFPVPLMKNTEGQWYFDLSSGKEEILARRIGQNEVNAIDTCDAVVAAQHYYYSQNHGGTKGYAQKFISDPGQQNGLYWESSQGQPRSPLGPLVVYATAQGYNLQPNQHRPFHGYYFAMLNKQGTDAQGGAKDYVVNGKMTGGFAVVAYPARYGESGIMTFIVNQNGAMFQKDLGKATDQTASAMTEFNPDKTWAEVQ